MSKIIWMIEMIYYRSGYKEAFPTKDAKPEMIPHRVKIIAFDKDEAKELISECNRTYSGASVERIRKPQVRGLTVQNLKMIEELLLKRLSTAIMDLETHPGDGHHLEKKIARYREVGRWIFNISDERGRK
jgi:hypothetical protein